MARMERRVALQIERYPVVHGAPWPAWEEYFRRLARVALERLGPISPRRAFHGGPGLGSWLVEVLDAPPGTGRHFAAPVPPTDKPAALADAVRAGRVAWMDRTDGLGSLRAFPPRSLDLAAVLWPAGPVPPPHRHALDAWLDAAFAALAPGRPVVAWTARDSAPEILLGLLRGIARDLDRRMDIPRGGGPDDPEEMRRRLEAAGFGEARAWMEGLSLAFADGASAVDHFLRRGGEALFSAVADPAVRTALRSRLAAALEEEYRDCGAVVVTFEAVLGIGRVPVEP